MMTAFDPSAGSRGVFDALIDARDRYGADKPILEDQERNPLTYNDLIRASFALGRKIAALTARAENVGILLPSSSGMAVTFFALHGFGRTPTMLNFTAGLRNLRAACKLAGVRRILTAHRFIEQGKLHDITDALSETCDIIYLEDLRAKIGLADKAYAAVAGALPRQFRAKTEPHQVGVVLFTSGSFGAPRGVVLSHENLVSNTAQIAAHIALDVNWVMFNPLPTFHCFGLTGGLLLPIFNGLKAFQYPSPLHVKQIPALVRDTKAAVLFATDTFINQYMRAGDPEDFSNLTFVVCGAERVREETHQLMAERAPGVPLLEGYGATEASPVIAVNLPSDNRRGTVGRVLPGIETRIESVAGINDGGRLFIKGPNVMSGYLNDEGGIDAPDGGWHDTGDVVTMSSDRWITIRGRVKRFAKIAGEMVSLTAAEELACAVWPDGRHAVIAMPDKRKGERLVLVTDRSDAMIDSLIAHAQTIGAPELTVPRTIVRVTEIPVLGTGKTDYVAIQRMAETNAMAA